MRLACTADGLKHWAARLGVRELDREDLAERVRLALAAKYPGPVLACARCGFSSPDHDAITSCPGCGIEFGGSMLAPSHEPKTANVFPMAVAKAPEPEAPSQPEDPAPLAPSERLAQLEKEIVALKTDAVRAEWRIGRHLNEILERDLWQSEEWKNFNEYAEKKFGFTRQTARAYMRIAEMFSSEQAANMPLGHLRLLTSIPDDSARKEVAERALRESPTFRELADQVKAKRAEAGLNTNRAGLEDTVHVSVRLPIGEVCAQGEWKEGKSRQTGTSKRIARFEIGGVKFLLDDLGPDGFVLRIPKQAVD